MPAYNPLREGVTAPYGAANITGVAGWPAARGGSALSCLWSVLTGRNGHMCCDVHSCCLARASARAQAICLAGAGPLCTAVQPACTHAATPGGLRVRPSEGWPQLLLSKGAALQPRTPLPPSAPVRAAVKVSSGFTGSRDRFYFVRPTPPSC